MFNSSIIDVAIGLVFVFLTLSLICSAANEGIESILKKRAKNLERGIRELLGDLSAPAAPDARQGGATVPPAPGQQPSGAADANKADQTSTDFVELLYNHGLINSLYRGKYGETPLSKLPSYIPSANFALAVLDLRKTVKSLPRNLQSALDTFDMKAKGDLDMLQRELENWYDSSMDRVSGWYKRQTQLIVVSLGLVAAIVLNVDSLYIARRLSTDPNLRQSVARIAEEDAKHPHQNQTPQASSTVAGTPASDQGTASATPSQPQPGQSGSPASEAEAVAQIRSNLQTLDGVGLPLGWQDFTADFRAKRAAQARALKQQGKTPAPEIRWAVYLEAGVEAVKLHGVGWIITALAVSLGAPFWFDMLNKIMVVRATVKPSEKSGAERSKDPIPPPPPPSGEGGGGDGQQAPDPSRN
jgi:hypothetical protein